MKAILTQISLGTSRLASVLWPILAFAQSSDLARNLEACKAGREVCDQSKLSPAAIGGCRSRRPRAQRCELQERLRFL